MTAIASMMLSPAEKAAPFQPLARWRDGAHSFIPEDTTPTEVDLLAQLAGVMHHPLLGARLADLVWLKDRCKAITYPSMAIDGYD